MKVALRKVRLFVNDRPFGTFAILFAMRDLALSLGFISGAGEIADTLMYNGMAEIVSPETFGILLAAMAIAIISSALFKKFGVMQIALDLQAFAWLLIGFIYWVHGGFFWAIVFGFFMSAASGYLSYRYKVKSLAVKLAGRYSER